MTEYEEKGILLDYIEYMIENHHVLRAVGGCKTRTFVDLMREFLDKREKENESEKV